MNRCFTLLAATCLALAAAAGAAPPAQRVLTAGTDQVTLIRDAYGVPHVFARTFYGLGYGSGFAAAEDRLGQMELNRRTARGEMAELVGARALAADRETRIDGYSEEERAAQFERMSPDSKAIFDGYAAGVNAYIEDAKTSGAAVEPANYPGRLDVAALRPWRVTDSIAVGQMMARRFGGDEGGELRNQMLYRVLRTGFKGKAPALFNDIAWRNDPASPTTVPASEAGSRKPGPPHWVPLPGVYAGKGRGAAGPGAPRLAAARFDARVAAAAARTLEQRARLDLASDLGLITRWGSYCIAVSGSRSATGSGLLVGGPQMGFRTPSIALEVHLSGAGVDCIGMSFPGVPGVLIGHNRWLAWSTTTGVGDQTDVFVETLDPADPSRYRYKGAWRTMKRRTETIAVAGASPVTLEVLSTVHGPVVQVDRANNLAYARCASYRDRELETFEGISRMQRARTVKEFGDACALIVTSHNFLCATRTGEIGYWFCGRLPVRDPRVDPRLPTPGDGTREWRGIVPFARMPRSVNPKQGFLCNWNNKPAPWLDCADTPAWGQVNHVQRITDLLSRNRALTPEALRDVVRDIGTTNWTAHALLPLLQRAGRRSPAALSPASRRAMGLLNAWNRHAEDGSAAAGVFDAWLQQVREDLFLRTYGLIKLAGPGLFETAMQPSLIAHVLHGPASPVPVCYDHLGGKSADRVMVDALNKAVASQARERGPDPAGWRYSRGLTNFAPLPGIPSTDRGTYIQIVECTRDAVRGVSILPPGQSERPASPHFGDQRDLAGWFQFKPMLTDRAALEAALKR